MKKQITKTLASLLIVNCISFSVLAQENKSNSSSDQSWLNISNSPKCAADMGSPADSIFITAALRNTGIMLKNLSKQTGQNDQFVGIGLKFYKTKLNILSKSIIDGLNSGSLPQVKTEVEAKNAWQRFEENTVSDSDTTCTQVNEVNSFYSNLFLRGVNQATLSQLAQKFSDAKSPLNCEPENIKSNEDLYPVYNYSLKIKDTTKWEQSGFDFWSSFKIYLSIAWKNTKNTTITSNPMNKITLITPMEEQVLLLSNGCKSIERPACNSDFLSSAELRTLFVPAEQGNTKAGLTGSSLEIKDLVLDNNDELDLKIKGNIATKSGDQQWISDFQRKYLAASSSQLDNLYAANKLFSTLYTHKKSDQLKADLFNDIANPDNAEETQYLCSEIRMLAQEPALNPYKFDLDNLTKNAGKLDTYLKYGMSVTEMITTFNATSESMLNACNTFDKGQKTPISENYIKYRSWYKNYISRYQSFKVAMDAEKLALAQNYIDERPKTYLKDQCINAIDCHRKMTESIVNLNKLLIHSKTLLRTEVQSAPVFNERAEKIACGTYDPFEASRLNKKKLIADLATSVLFGWTSLPIYLDVNFKPKELVSFTKLMQDGKIQFDTEFDKNQITRTLSLNLGSFINVPCSVSISQTSTDLSNTNSNYIFKGLAVNACKGNKNQTVDSPNGAVDNFRKTPESDFQACGQCALNFEQVATSTSLNLFAPLRFFIRLGQSLARYNAVKNDDTINPQQFNISTKYLLDTYKQNNNTIPEQCVPMLAKGLSCQKNVCEALAVKEFEIKSGLSIESIELGQSSNNNGFEENYDSAWIKIKDCGDKKIRLNMQCSGQGDRFWMSVSERSYKQCLK